MKKLIIALILLMAVPCFGATLSWNASDRADGYIVYYSAGSEEYSNDVGNVTEIQDMENVLNLVVNVDYSIAVSAYNSYGESAKCSPVSYTREGFTPTTNPAPVIINIPPDTPTVTINVGQ